LLKSFDEDCFLSFCFLYSLADGILGEQTTCHSKVLREPLLSSFYIFRLLFVLFFWEMCDELSPPSQQQGRRVDY
jgi:hypothetical protein